MTLCAGLGIASGQLGAQDSVPVSSRDALGLEIRAATQHPLVGGRFEFDVVIVNRAPEAVRVPVDDGLSTTATLTTSGIGLGGGGARYRPTVSPRLVVLGQGATESRHFS